MRILGSGWWSRPPAPPPPTADGRDVSARIAKALRWALHGSDTGDRGASCCGAVTLAAAAFERALSAAEVHAAEPTASAVRAILPTAGRQVVTRGEAAYLVHTNGRLALEPVSIVDGSGTWERPVWRVRRWSPGGEWAEIDAAPDRLLHVVWSPDPDSGGLVGRPPWESAAADAAAALEGQLTDVGRLPVMHSLLVSDRSIAWDDEALIEFYEGAEEHLGRGGRSAGTGFAPFVTQGSAEVEQLLKTVRGEYDSGSSNLHNSLTSAVAASCGLPPVLLSPNAAGTGYRDAWRSFVAGAAQAAATTLARAVEDQLGVSVGIELRAKHNTPADIVSRARAVRSLSEAGIGTTMALRLAGLET